MLVCQGLEPGKTRGWNTWARQSLTCHTLMPEGAAVSVGLKERRTGNCLKEIRIDHTVKREETVYPGLRSPDGGYTELEVNWRDIAMKVFSARAEDGGLLMRVQVESAQLLPPAVIVDAGILWGRPGRARRDGGSLIFDLPERKIQLWVSGRVISEPYTDSLTPYLALSADGAPVTISESRPYDPDEVWRLIQAKRAQTLAGPQSADILSAAWRDYAGWAMVYSPEKNCLILDTERI